jgi:hypothetical protein
MLRRYITEKKIGLGLLQCDVVSLYCIPSFQKILSSSTKVGEMGSFANSGKPNGTTSLPEILKPQRKTQILHQKRRAWENTYDFRILYV